MSDLTAVHFFRDGATWRLADVPQAEVYDERTGDPLAGGPICSTCGALAAFDSHPACDYLRGSLLVWRSRPSHGVVVVHDDSALMVAAAAGGNGFRTELREPTPEEVEEYLARSEP